jgi:hypothetical protein
LVFVFWGFPRDGVVHTKPSGHLLTINESPVLCLEKKSEVNNLQSTLDQYRSKQHSEEATPDGEEEEEEEEEKEGGG